MKYFLVVDCLLISVLTCLRTVLNSNILFEQPCTKRGGGGGCGLAYVHMMKAKKDRCSTKISTFFCS